MGLAKKFNVQHKIFGQATASPALSIPAVNDGAFRAFGKSSAPTDAGALGREAGKLLLASASAAGSADVPGSGSAPSGDPTAEEILANFDLIDKDRNGWLYDIEFKGATMSSSQDLRRIGEYLQNNPTIRGLVWDVHVSPDGKHAFYDGVVSRAMT